MTHELKTWPQQIEVEVTYILCGGAFGIKDGFVVMGIKK